MKSRSPRNGGCTAKLASRLTVHRATKPESHPPFPRARSPHPRSPPATIAGRPRKRRQPATTKPEARPRRSGRQRVTTMRLLTMYLSRSQLWLDDEDASPTAELAKLASTMRAPTSGLHLRSTDNSRPCSGSDTEHFTSSFRMTQFTVKFIAGDDSPQGTVE